MQRIQRQTGAALALRDLDTSTAVAHDHHRVVAPSASAGPRSVLTGRTIYSFNTRTMKLMGLPAEFKFYQRMTNNPSKYSGVQFLTHFRDHHRGRSGPEAVVDYLFWGKTNGQAFMPHRQQRVAFDWNDSVNPTRLPEYTGGELWTESRDGSFHDAEAQYASSTFDANGAVFNNALHRNTMFTRRGPQQSSIRLPHDWQSNSLLRDIFNVRDTPSAAEFHADPLQGGAAYAQLGVVPGLNAPYRGEPDHKLMEAMARAIPGTDNAVCKNNGRYSGSLYLNRPQADNLLRGRTCRDLARAIDVATNGLRKKMVVLKAAQSGQTDAFCSGLDLEEVAHDLRMWDARRAAANALQARQIRDDPLAAKVADLELQRLREESEDYLIRADRTVRDAQCLLWRVFAAQRPLMTIVNGRCRNVGNGLALYAKYPGLRDSTEFTHDGALMGVTPFGGLTHLLARTETTLKYPGLAEYVMLTGFPLYAGDALRLGWSDLFSTLPDVDYHVRQWFDDSEHMHNDAVTWQIGHLLESCFMMKDHHSVAMERTALTPLRARWIEDAFADQPSVAAIMATLGEMERVPLTDPSNAADANYSRTTTLPSVEAGVRKLNEGRMSATVEPWGVSAPPEDANVTSSLSEIFTRYFFERRDGAGVAAPGDEAKLARWRAVRDAERAAFASHVAAAHPRHVFVRLEGPEGRLVAFEFAFDKAACEAGAVTQEERDTAMLRALKREVAKQLGMAEDRALSLQWKLPTLDSAALLRDSEVLQMLHADPGIEDARNPTRLPPLYLSAVRDRLHMSEWAYGVKHQLLLLCPTAVRASFELLHAVRGDGTEKGVKSVSEALALEFRFATRMMRRPDFFRVGVASQRPASAWEEKSATAIHDAAHPIRADAHSFDDVFERDVTIDGHRFLVRPRWEPRLLADVKEADVKALGTELDFMQDRTTELHAPTETNHARRVAETVFETIGYEVTPQLGETDKVTGEPKVAPLKTDAHVPTNVNFYEMARHPWTDQPHSWRTHGYTDASQRYMEKKYHEAVQQLHDPEGQGAHQYWPKAARPDRSGARKRDEVAAEEPEEVLLRDRFWGAVKEAQRDIEGWAQQARAATESQKFDYRLEVTTPEEKIYDDEYYRWFAFGNPNKSGVIIPTKAKKSE